jgi:alanine racemase
MNPDAPRVTLDRSALLHNLALLRHAAPGAKLMAAVKANAYGHGASLVAPALAAAGVDAFGVATAEEALELRALGLDTPILLFSPVRHLLAELIDADVALCVASQHDLEAIERAAGRASRRVQVHLKVDTGMGRLGASQGAAVTLAKALDRSASCTLAGLFTHLAQADDDRAGTAGDATDVALTSFGMLIDELEQHGIRPPVLHAANSAAALTLPRSHFDLIRPGLALYGAAPSAAVAATLKGPGLRPVLELDAPITFLKRVSAGTPISYGGTWRAPRDTLIATVRCGYADGYPRGLSSLGMAAHRGRQVLVAGRVCMDQLMVDLGPEAEAELGERITLIGRSSDGPAATVEALCEVSGGFVYELFTGIGARVERAWR